MNVYSLVLCNCFNHFIACSCNVVGGVIMSTIVHSGGYRVCLTEFKHKSTLIGGELNKYINKQNF